MYINLNGIQSSIFKTMINIYKSTTLKYNINFIMYSFTVNIPVNTGQPLPLSCCSKLVESPACLYTDYVWTAQAETLDPYLAVQLESHS